MSIKSIGADDIKQFLEDDKKLEEQVKIIGEHIVINVAYEYNIPLATCTTHKEVLNWVWHLTEKTWMNQDVTRRFIELACGHHKLEYRF